MESNSNNRDFERFLKEATDRYRMLPSDNVWKGINNTLHTRRRWYGLGLAFLLLLTVSAVTLVMLSYPVSRPNMEITSARMAKAPELNDGPVTEISLAPTTTQTVEQGQKKDKKTLPFSNESSIIVIETVSPEATGANPPATTTGNTSASNNITIAAEEPGITVVTASPVRLSAISEQNTAALKNALHRQAASIALAKEATARAATVPLLNLPPEQAPVETGEEIKEKESLASAIRFEDRTLLPTIESVINSFREKRSARKLQWQMYFTPSISYRKLTENKSGTDPALFNPNSPQATQPSDVNKAVTHKPDLGLELGLAARYPITERLKLRGAVQFNINRYDIKAFIYTGEMANIDVSNGNGNNYISAWTYYNNYSGYRSDWLKNFYFSISAPIGAEYRLLGNNRTNVGITGTIQPTYVISDRAYLISTDYKNYAEIPWLIRRVNVSTSFETFVGFRTGHTKWQVGPQARYQLLSSFRNKYPVKENLFDYGLKIGMSLNP